MLKERAIYLTTRLVTLLAALLAAVVAVPSESFAGQPHVSDVRVGQNSSRTRVVLELDQAVKFDVFTLHGPYRVVLNLPAVGWTLNPATLPENKGVLARMRYGLFTPTSSRMVLDVNGPVKVEKSFLLKTVDGKRWRLVLDLIATTETEFLEALAAKRSKDRNDLAALVARTAKSTPATASVPAIAPPAPSRETASVLPPRKPAAPGKRIIAIDPGHGGVDPGTIGIGKTYEKNVTLAMARQLKKTLEATGRYKVVMTRSRVIFVRLRDRVAVARDAGADLFISVHADSVVNRKTRGLSVYTLSEKASDKEAAKLAAKENKADLIAGIDLSTESTDVTSILLDLAQRETMNQSALFATDLVKELRREVKLLRNTHRFAGFAVLKAPDMPSVLVEAGFLSNRQDERNLLSTKYRQGLANAILRGVDRHFSGVEQALIH